MAVISRHFTEFGRFVANHVKEIEIRPTLSVCYKNVAQLESPLNLQQNGI